MTALRTLLFAAGVGAVNNGLARTPQMGWNNWNSLACDVSEDLLVDTSAHLVNYGLKDLGYNYVVLDDCWQTQDRGTDGHMIVDSKKFPNGMKAVADRIHYQGLRFGMYSSAGYMTCAKFAGSLDYEDKDAEMFASFDIDYLKYDNCHNAGRSGYAKISFDRYNVMAQALKSASKKPILYSLCQWGQDQVHEWGSAIANSWRIGGDIWDSFARPDDMCGCGDDPTMPLCTAPGTHCSVLAIINRVAPYVDKSAPGGWNDLDMLEVGIGGMTDDEYVAHMSLWAALKSPLLLGNDLRIMDAKTLSIVNNPAILAISQDPSGRAVQRVARNTSVPKDAFGVGETHVWSGPLTNGDQVVIMLNVADTELHMSVDLSDVFLGEGVGGTAPQIKQGWEIFDLWGARMKESDAEKVLKAKSGAEGKKILKSLGWYNAEETSYAVGLENEDERLFGTKIGTVSAHGKLEYDIPRHAAKVLRLRKSSGTNKERVGMKTEL